MKRSITRFTSVALVCSVFAGCGSPSVSSSPASSGSSSATTDSTLVIAINADLSTMDLSIATDGSSFQMINLCESGLTAIGKENDIKPALAKSWDVSEDGLTYTFHLDPAAKWSDGSSVKAEDFVYGWQRLADPATASEYNFIVSTVHIANADEVIAGEKAIDELGVKAVDDSTLEVTLSLPCDFLLSLMAFPSFFPLRKEFCESKGDQYALSPDDLLFCGAYDMTGWEQGAEYTFTRNEDYIYNDPEAVDTIVYKFIQDTQSAMLAYERGDIDVVTLTGDQVDMYKDSDGFTGKLTGTMWYISFNFLDEALANEHLRAALSYAVDTQVLCDNVLRNGSVPAEGIIPLDLASGPDGKDFRDTAGDLMSYDPVKAGEEYAKAVEELGEDPTITLLFDDAEDTKSVAENLQSQFETNCPGLTIALDSKPKKTRLQLMREHDYDFALTRWGPDYADPQTFMDLFLTDNAGCYSDPAYDKRIEDGTKGVDAADSTKRWTDMIEAEKILLSEDYAILPLYQVGSAMMVNPKVTGIETHTAAADNYRTVHKAQ